MNRKYVAAFSLGYMVANTLAFLAYQQQEKRYDKLLKQARLNFKIIESFINHSDYSVMKQVHDDIEFDWIVRDI